MSAAVLSGLQGPNTGLDALRLTLWFFFRAGMLMLAGLAITVVALAFGCWLYRLFRSEGSQSHEEVDDV